MTQSTGFPIEVLNANLALQARLMKLVQENGQRWLGFGRDLAAKATVAANKEVADALRTGDWQKLASMPVEAFWAPLQRQFNTSRELAESAAAAQTAFVQGLQDALRTWQKDVTRALGADSSARPLGGPAWIDLLSPWQQWLSDTGKQPGASRKS